MPRGPLSWIALALTFLNLAGPLYLALQIRRHRPLIAGEILWGWLGLVWAMLLINHEAHSSHGGFIARMELMAQGARLTLALALLLALYARRPEQPGSAWAIIWAGGSRSAM